MMLKRADTCFLLGMLVLALFSACHSRVEPPESAVSAEPASWPETFELGREASQAEIDSLDIDVSPSGVGLPAGSGTALKGKGIFMQKCSSCHGATGTEGPFNKLVSVAGDDSKTIGNYWPYATTVYDYINRTMPFNEPGSLTPDEVYSLTAYLLSANGIIDENNTVDEKTLPSILMPARNLFVPDDRLGGPEVK